MFPILPDLPSFLDVQYAKEARGVTAWMWGWRIHPHPDTGHVRSWHNGLDIAAPVRTPIHSPLPGIIAKIQRQDVGISGKFLRIRHDDPEHPEIGMTRYAHLDGFARGLKEGDRVIRGQLVAYVGNSGQSTGPHLHFMVNLKEIRQTANGWRDDVDPLPYVRASVGGGALGGVILGGGLILAGLLYYWYSKH